MSRGLGKVERELLDELERTGMVTVAPRELSAAEKEARRRAARSLDRKGLAAVRQNRGTNLLLTMRKAVDWDVRHGERALEKAQEKENEARKEGWNAWRAVRVADPSSRLDITKERQKNGPELRITVKSIRGGVDRIDMLLNDLESQLGSIWQFSLPTENKDGSVTFCATIVEKPRAY